MRMKKLIDVSLTMSFSTTLTGCHAHWHTVQHQSISTAVCPKPAFGWISSCGSSPSSLSLLCVTRYFGVCPGLSSGVHLVRKKKN